MMKVLLTVYLKKKFGIMLDDKLSWKLHMNHICNNVSKAFGILVKARRILGIDSLVTLYNTLIKPYFPYCITYKYIKDSP